MSQSDIRLHLDLADPMVNQPQSLLNPQNHVSQGPDVSSQPNSQPHPQLIQTQKMNRRRSNSQSQVISTPNIGFNDISNSPRETAPPKRKQVQYFVTLVSLNDTFVTKHLSVPYFPDSRKLGRPSGAKIKPDVTNGFFDSRVLSRNHAIMYVDGNNGKLMLKDLGSSNGTFVNNKKLDSDPVEIKLGDNICFGFNIQVGINHKQINCKVENINIMSDLIPNDPGLVHTDSMDTVEFQFYQYVQGLYNKVSVQNRKSDLKEQSKKPSMNFESALFGDINPDIEDDLLGLYTKADNGIFKNSGTVSSSKLEHSMNMLINCFTKLKQQNHSLNTVENFLTNYYDRVNDLNNKYLAQQMEQKFTELYKKIAMEKSNNDKITRNYDQLRNDNFKKIKKLEEKVFNLKSDKSKLLKRVDQLTSQTETLGSKAEHRSKEFNRDSFDEKRSSLNGSKLSFTDLDDQIEENSVDNSSEDSKKEDEGTKDNQANSAHDPLTQLLTNSLHGLNSLDPSGKTQNVKRAGDTKQPSHTQTKQSSSSQSPNEPVTLAPPIISELDPAVDSSPELGSESELDLSPKISNSTTASSVPSAAASVTSFDPESDTNNDLRYPQNNIVFLAIISVIMGFIVNHTLYE